MYIQFMENGIDINKLQDLDVSVIIIKENPSKSHMSQIKVNS